jgi:large subunit ribosomal protein L4
MKAPVWNTAKQEVGSIDLSDPVFGGEVNEALLWEVVRMQLAKRRQGTHDTKGRSEISGGGKKPWRQKGTGRARSGSSRSPVWRGGGTVFGPTPRSYAYSMPKKKRRAALYSLDSLELPGIKTKALASALKGLGVESALLVIPGKDEVMEKSARNIPWVKVLRVEGLNVYDILRHEKLVFLRSAAEKLEGGL